MTKNQEHKLQEEFEKQLQKQFTNGLLQGSKAICAVVLDKINNLENVSPEGIIQDLKIFCEQSLGLPDIR